jgi:hypothetical protein
MIKFDISKIEIHRGKMKSITTALSGSMRLVDEQLSLSKGVETTIRIPVPMSVARAFQQLHKASNWLHPVEVVYMTYEGTVLCIEKRPSDVWVKSGSGWTQIESPREWNPLLYENLNYLEQTYRELQSEDWYIDGKNIYHLPKSLSNWSNTGEAILLSADFKFKAKRVMAYRTDLMHLSVFTTPLSTYLAIFFTNDGVPHLSPPIWKDVSSLGVRQMKRSDEEAHEKMEAFDRIEKFLSVNLNFTLYAANTISSVFGYEEISPLQLPKLMVQLKTVNLPNVPNVVKDTFDVGLSFSHALAWLIGLSERVSNLDDYMKIRQTIKYLGSKGIFRNTLFKQEQVFNKSFDISSIKMISPEEAAKLAPTLTVPGRYLSSLTKKLRKMASEGRSGSGISDLEDDQDTELDAVDRERTSWTNSPEYGSSVSILKT